MLGLWAVAIPVAAVVFAMLLGLGLHRHAPPLAVSTAATVLTFGPALMATGSTRRRRELLLPLAIAGWCAALLLVLPVYFPGERRAAVTSGLSLVGAGTDWERVAKAVAEQLPPEPILAEPELPEALAVAAEVTPAPIPLEPHQIALPYEGEGRRLSVPVVFEHGYRSFETQMMLDTGATYTTLPTATLERLGVSIDESAPAITLHTANGERSARMVLLDRIWLGDQAIDDVAIAVCDACGSSGNVGLLGLNVAGGFNVLIDADRREVVFTGRAEHDRHLDVGPFVDVNAQFSRYPGGRVEVRVAATSQAPRPVSRLEARVSCGDQRWLVQLDDLEAGGAAEKRIRLPAHQPCDGYRIGLESAWW